MRLFYPSDLRAKPFNELRPGECFYDISAYAWSIVFELPVSNDRSAEKFTVPLGGDMSLVAALTPDPTLTEAISVLAFELKDSFSVRLDTAPSEDALNSVRRPLVILNDGPAILSELQKSRHLKPVPGFLLHLRSFEISSVSSRQVEMLRPVAVPRWSLVFSSEPNLGTVLFQHQPTSPKAAAA